MSAAFIVVDLGYGDAGKGTTVDALCRRLRGASTVVRFNGGAQAAHNVVTPDGLHHTFSQFGSGMLHPYTRTHLSRFMLINPLNMFTEGDHLKHLGIRNAWERTTVDPRALIITPYHKALNRLRELARGPGRHGSCGQGIGETVMHSKFNPDGALRAGQLRDKGTVRCLLPRIKDYCVEEVRDLRLPGTDVVRAELDQLLLTDETQVVYAYEGWASRLEFMEDNRLGDEPAYHMGSPLIFEGAQGILLDETHGHHPHTTWSTCTTKNAMTIINELESFDYDVVRLGVTRTYMTRHGRGPFPTEDEKMTKMMFEPYNGYGAWQEGWRCGFLDIPSLQYSIEVTDGIDGLVVTHMDKIPEDGLPVVFDYEDTSFDDGGFDLYAVAQRVRRDDFTDMIADSLQTPVCMTSWGPTAKDKHFMEVGVTV